MNRKQITLAALTLLFLTSCKTEKGSMNQLYDQNGYVHVTTPHDVTLVYPKTVQEIEARTHDVMNKITNIVNEIIAVPLDQQNKINMLYAFDSIYGASCQISILHFVQQAYPDESLRNAAAQACIQLQNAHTDIVSMNVDLYHAFKHYVSHNAQQEDLTHEERYFLNELMKDFKRSGLDLPEEDRKAITALMKELDQIEQDFSLNISADTSTITATRDELAGVTEQFIATLSTDENGKYILHTDYPTADMISNYCAVQDTRKRFIQAFRNKAYPKNVEILTTLIKKRHELATKLGFKNFAELDLDSQMIKTPERAWEFEQDLEKRAVKKACEEFKELTATLPEGVTLSPEGKLYPWDAAYVSTYFKKHVYNVDERELAKYFPMETTIAGLISIYEQFFSLKIKDVPAGTTWHPDVQLLAVHDATTNETLGYVYLDMYPRNKKYGHAAQFGAIPAHISADGTRYPAVVALVCNFTKPTKTEPSLLRYAEVNTFFHEFGHALHSILGATRLASQAGTNVKRDFVELPSQMLENWLEDRNILKNLSCHYQTGEQLPDELLDQKLKLLKFGLGMSTCGQISYGMIALDYFDTGSANTTAIWKKHSERLLPYMVYDETTHAQCSFGHLCGYGAKYYGYLWSDVLGQDVFEQIEKDGLVNPETGKRYRECILEPGGSKDPDELLYSFLGRQPSSDAFFRRMGL